MRILAKIKRKKKLKKNCKASSKVSRFGTGLNFNWKDSKPKDRKEFEKKNLHNFMSLLRSISICYFCSPLKSMISICHFQNRSLLPFDMTSSLLLVLNNIICTCILMVIPALWWLSWVLKKKRTLRLKDLSGSQERSTSVGRNWVQYSVCLVLQIQLIH